MATFPFSFWKDSRIFMPSAGPYAAAGPYTGFGNQPVTNFPSATYDGTLTLTGDDQSEPSPLQYNKLTLTGATINAYNPDGDSAIDFTVPQGIFLRVNELAIGLPASIINKGGDGGIGASGVGGRGGSGASGGGGGAAYRTGCCCTVCCPVLYIGGEGGSAGYGAYGQSANCSTPGGGGAGNGSGLLYTYGNGSTGDSENGGFASGGAGANGCGGGGGGGSVNVNPSPCGFYAGGGGGAGGGVIVVLGNLLSGGALNVSSPGGIGQIGDGGFIAGNGGNGVIWLAFKRKTAGTITVGSGTLKLFQLTSNGTLVAKNPSDVW